MENRSTTNTKNTKNNSGKKFKDKMHVLFYDVYFFVLRN